MKKFLLFPCLLLFSATAFSQLWSDGIQIATPNQFALYTNATTSIGSRTISSGLRVSISIGGSLDVESMANIGPTPNGAYVTSDWPSNSDYNNNRYIQFTIEALPGTATVSITNFTFRGSRNGDGPEDYTLRGGSGTGVWNTTTYGGQSNTIPNNTSGTTYNINFSTGNIVTLSAGQTKSFRLYLKDADDNDGVFRLHSFSFGGNVTLPVEFGTVEAEQKNNAVAVKWTTLKESNNDYFEVQASKDGQNFTTVKTVSSANGNSDTLQQYEVSITASDIASLLGAPLLLGLLSLGFNRRRRLTIGALALVMLGVNFIGCSQQGDAIDIDTIGKVFVRIKQVDKDGTAKYSEIIQVIRK